MWSAPLKITRQVPDEPILSYAVRRSAVRVKPAERFEAPVTLAAIKADPQLAEMALLRQGRLSVAPVTEAEFARLRTLGKARAL